MLVRLINEFFGNVYNDSIRKISMICPFKNIQERSIQEIKPYMKTSTVVFFFFSNLYKNCP